jgi:Ca-activated chloride channel family protein
MKKIASLLLSLTLSLALYGNGVVIPDSASVKYLPLISTSVHVKVDGQVAITRATQVYRNTADDSVKVQFAYPMPVEASALTLEYSLHGQWYQASFAAEEQDSLSGGGGTGLDYTLVQYLGENPLIYTMDEALFADSLLTVELTYVELLEYKLGKVNYHYPNDYSLIGDSIPGVVDLQKLVFTLVSERTIEVINLLSHPADSSSNSGNEAAVHFSVYEEKAEQDYHVQYALNQEELGLYSYSIFLPDSVVPDSCGNGFFLFVAEPDPSENQQVIDKVFTLIIDRSGSMSGDKIVQARNAAKFIVHNLNLGDKFNIIDFSNEVRSFRQNHVDFTTENEDAAITYINALDAGGSTNISGAFGMAVPQFSAASTNTANIIIFFTDGKQTAGITGTDELIEYVDNLIVQNEAPLNLFTFGIGPSTNERLLTTIAAHNNGLADFLGNEELESKITEFYLLIRNPVLINTEISADPDLLSEVYPVQLPNLYKGQQMILAGRYDEAAPFTLELAGEAFGNPVSYQYSPELSESNIDKYSFVPKVWAKKKIEKLLTNYYLLNSSSDDADSIKQVIIDVSLAYRVISPFTSFQGSIAIEYGGGWDNKDYYGGTQTSFPLSDDPLEFDQTEGVQNQVLLHAGNYPNPFTRSTTITFKVTGVVYEPAVIRIFDAMGRLVAEYHVSVQGTGEYELFWNPAETLLDLPAGMYAYTISLAGEQVHGRMIYEKR